MEFNNASETFDLGGEITVSNDITITAGTLDVTASDHDLIVDGNWSKSEGSDFIAKGGTVIFNNSSLTSRISGSTTFDNLTCITANKVLEFEAGSTQTVTGLINLSGGAGAEITLRTIADGAGAWNVNLPVLANRTLQFLNLKEFCQYKPGARRREAQ